MKDRTIFVDDRVGKQMPQAKADFMKIPEYVGVISYGKAGSSGRTCFYNLDNKHSYSKANVTDEHRKGMGNLVKVSSSTYKILSVKFSPQKAFIFLCERSSLENATEYSMN